MLSRVANSLFWLGRYLERAEFTARFLVVTHSYAQELRAVSHAAADHSWTVARTLLGAPEIPDESGAATFRRLAFDPDLANSVLAGVTRARENARGIRDAIASEMWEELNVLYLRVQQEADAQPSETAEISLLQRIATTSHLFQGMRDNVMSRSEERHFLALGQYLERAQNTARTLDVMFSHPALHDAAQAGRSIDTHHLVATIRACLALEALTRAGYSLTAEDVVEFLLLDARFPRSVVYGVQEVGNALHAISGTPQDVFSNDAEQLCGRLVAELRFADVEEIMRDGLHPYLHRVLTRLDQTAAAISGLYFR